MFRCVIYIIFRENFALLVCFLLGNSQSLNFICTYPLMKMEQSVPKRRHIKYKGRGITQEKAYKIQNTVKV